MKLNVDYVRDILLYIEENVKYDDASNPNRRKEIMFGKLLADKTFDQYNKEELTYALELLIKERFIECAKEPYFVRGNLELADIVGLTWAGHELLDNLRNSTILEAVKERAKKTGGASIGIIAKASEAIGIALMSDPNAIENLKQGIINLSQMIH